MIDRRALALLLLGATAGLSACASEDEPAAHSAHRGGGGPEAEDQGPEMLFISPMGEPFRAHAPAPYPVEAWFKGADKNNDGKVDLAEFLADAERFFHVLDITKDGVIDHREVFYYEHKLVPEVLTQADGALVGRGAPAKIWRAQYGGAGGGMGGMGGGMGNIGAPGGPPVTDGGSSGVTKLDTPLVGAAPFGLLADPEPVRGSDIRLTGVISLGDFKTRAEQRFKLLDDEDKGYLTLTGLPKTEAEKLMPHPRGGRRGPRHST
jgi:hypothetical protein